MTLRNWSRTRASAGNWFFGARANQSARQSDDVEQLYAVRSSTLVPKASSASPKPANFSVIPTLVVRLAQCFRLTEGH